MYHKLLSAQVRVCYWWGLGCHLCVEAWQHSVPVVVYMSLKSYLACCHFFCRVFAATKFCTAVQGAPRGPTPGAAPGYGAPSPYGGAPQYAQPQPAYGAYPGYPPAAAAPAYPGYGGGYPQPGGYGGYPQVSAAPYGGQPGYGGAGAGGYDPYGASGQQAYGGAGGYGQQPAQPAAQPAGGGQWQELQDNEGRSYYYNQITGVSQWDRPADM